MGNSCFCIDNDTDNSTIIFNISSINLDLHDTSNITTKIDSITEHINRTNYDVVCLQGLRDKQATKKLIKNLLLKTTYSIYPSMSVLSNKNLLLLKKSSDSSQNSVDCLILTKHKILSSCKVEIPNILDNNGLPHVQKKYVYVINILFNNIVISIYNFSSINELQNINDKQIELLNEIIRQNNLHIDSHEIFNLYESRNIHFICCLLKNIPETIDNEPNDEYISLIKKLKVIDVFRYVQIKNKKQKYNMTNYIFLKNDKLFHNFTDDSDLFSGISKNLKLNFNISIYDGWIDDNIYLNSNKPITCSIGFYITDTKPNNNILHNDEIIEII